MLFPTAATEGPFCIRESLVLHILGAVIVLGSNSKSIFEELWGCLYLAILWSLCCNSWLSQPLRVHVDGKILHQVFYVKIVWDGMFLLQKCGDLFCLLFSTPGCVWPCINAPEIDIFFQSLIPPFPHSPSSQPSQQDAALVPSQDQETSGSFSLFNISQQHPCICLFAFVNVYCYLNFKVQDLIVSDSIWPWYCFL